MKKNSFVSLAALLSLVLPFSASATLSKSLLVNGITETAFFSLNTGVISQDQVMTILLKYLQANNVNSGTQDCIVKAMKKDMLFFKPFQELSTALSSIQESGRQIEEQAHKAKDADRNGKPQFDFKNETYLDFMVHTMQQDYSDLIKAKQRINRTVSAVVKSCGV